jgi:HK97 gp10 family phage protein
MSGVTTISGLKELDAMLKQLPANIERNVIRAALKKGQEVLADAVKSKLRSNGSVDSGELEKSVRVRFKRRSEKFGWIRSYVMAGSKEAYYAHMVEFGTASYYEGNGRTVGGPYKIYPKVAGSLFLGSIFAEATIHPGIKPKPFMRPTADNYSDAAIDAVANYMTERIPKEMKKAGL